MLGAIDVGSWPSKSLFTCTSYILVDSSVLWVSHIRSAMCKLGFTQSKGLACIKHILQQIMSE